MDIKLEDWTQEYILELLGKGVFECDYFEFKEMLPHSQDDRGKDRLATACGSFANSEGGFLIFGIKDDRSLSAGDRLVGMDRKIDFPMLFGSFPQKCEPSIHWIPKNPAIELSNGNVVNIILIPKSIRAPHAVGKPEQGLRFPKRTNQGVDYMSSIEIKNSYLGYYEKRVKVQLLYAEIGNIATDAKSIIFDLNVYREFGSPSGSTNLYGYSFNDPVNYVDPSGKFGIAGATVGFISGGIGGYVTGGAWGAVAGSVAGALVGAVVPTASGAAGAFVGGVASSFLGQFLGNLVSGAPPLTFDPALAVASGFGGATGALGVGAAAAAGVTNVGAQAGIATVSDLLFNVPANSLSPGPYNFGNLCK